MKASISVTPARSAAVDHALGISGGQRQRLLAQDVLARSAAAMAHSAWRWFGSGM